MEFGFYDVRRSVAVVMRRKDECRGPGPLEVAAASSGGYLASVVTEETGCGSPDSPWLLRAPAGQTIQLRLLDFDAASRDSWTPEDSQQPLICQVESTTSGHRPRLIGATTGCQPETNDVDRRR